MTGEPSLEENEIKRRHPLVRTVDRWPAIAILLGLSLVAEALPLPGGLLTVLGFRSRRSLARRTGSE
jgi:hypothetical protein